MSAPAGQLQGRRLTGMVYLASLLAIATFANLEEDFTPLLVAGVAASFAWVFIDWEGFSWRLVNGVPKLIVNIIVVLGAGWFLLEIMEMDAASHGFVSALGHMTILLLVCKLFERKAVRDVLVIFVLGFLLVVSSTMYQQDMLQAVLVAGFFVVLCYAGMATALHEEVRRAQAVPARTSADAAHGMVVLAGWNSGSSRRSPFTRDLRKMARWCAGLLLPIAMLVFLLVPRTRPKPILSNWTSDPGPTAQVTGFTDIVEFHDYGQIKESDDPVMDVRIRQEGSEDTTMVDAYFRAVPLDTYLPREKQWINGAEARWGDQDLVNLFQDDATPLYENLDQAAGAQFGDHPLIEQDYTLYVPTHYVYSIAPPRLIGKADFDQLRAVPDEYSLQLDHTIGKPGKPLHYTIWSMDPAMPLPADDPGPASRVGIPQVVIDLATKVAGNRLPANGQWKPETIRVVAAAFENYLRGNYPYSLEYRQVDPALDPTADFLLNRQSTGGHCEFFASAMVMMCRGVGINARIVTGFHGGQYNSLSRKLVVRAKDAHAWVEYYVPGEGWVTSDPSPVGVGTMEGEWFITRWARELKEIVASAWNSAVVSFDDDSRRSVTRAVRRWLAEAGESTLDFFRPLWIATVHAASWQDQLGSDGAVLGIGSALGWMIWRWRYQRRFGRAQGGGRRGAKRKAGPELAMLDEVLRLIARRAGLKAPRGEGETPMEFVNAHAVALGEAAADARIVVRGFYEVYFGAGDARKWRTRMTDALARLRKSKRA